MKNIDDFIFINHEDIEKSKVFSYGLYIFNPSNKKVSSFLKKFSPLTKDKKYFLELILQKGGYLCIERNDKEALLTQFPEAKKNLIDPLDHMHPLEKERELHLKNYRPLKSEEFYSLIKFTFDTESFDKINEFFINEVLTFDPTTSKVTSACYKIIRGLKEENIKKVELAAITYSLLRLHDIYDQNELSIAILATFLCDIGETQMPWSFKEKSYTELSSGEAYYYKKHTGAVYQILSGIDFPEKIRITKIVSEHHDYADGSGFGEKRESSLDRLSLYISFVSHILDLRNARINTKNIKINDSLRAMANNFSVDGLKSDFGVKLNETIDTFARL